MERPETWHYGVIAKWWAEFNVSGPEIAYFQRFIEDDGQPALDAACGTGRLLVPYLRGRDGQLVESGTHGLKMTLYFRNELLLMLERTGFADIVVRGGYTDAEPTSDDDFLVFVAKK